MDGVFIGPSDFAASLGYLGNTTHPEVVGLIEAAIERIVAAGKAAGILSTDNALAQSYIDKGVTVCAVGVDTQLLSSAATALASKFKG